MKMKILFFVRTVKAPLLSPTFVLDEQLLKLTPEKLLPFSFPTFLPEDQPDEFVRYIVNGYY